METGGITAYLDNTASNAITSAGSAKTSRALGGISAQSSDEEIENAVKSFESFLLEQVIKQVRESTEALNDDEDSSMSQYRDMYMDSTISQIASEIVDEQGGRLTDELVAQIKRNYGIK